MGNLVGEKLVFNITEGGNYQVRSYHINGQISGFIELYLLPGETNVELIDYNHLLKMESLLSQRMEIFNKHFLQIL